MERSQSSREAAVAAFLLVCAPSLAADTLALKGIRVDASSVVLRGCEERISREYPPNPGAVTLALSCGAVQAITFTAAFPDTIESPASAGSLDLPSPVSVPFSATWSWATPPAPPTTFDLGLSVTGVGSPSDDCAASASLRDVPPGQHTLSGTAGCSTRRACSWDSGKRVAHVCARAATTFYKGDPFDPTPFAGPLASLTVSGVYGPPDTGADLEVTISAEREVTDRSAPFTVTVRNKGPEAATDVRLSVWSYWENYREFISRSDCSTFTDRLLGPGVCGIASLAPGGTASVSLEVEPEDDGDSEYLSVNAEVASATPDPAPSNNRASSGTEYTRCGDSLETCAYTVYAAQTCLPPERAPWSRATPAGGALAALKATVSALAAAAVDFSTLYRLRDEVFARTPAGRRYTELYYAHTAEVARLVATDASFRTRFGDTYGLWRDHLAKLVGGQGASAVVSQAQVDALGGFLRELKTLGTPELRAVVAREEAALDLPSLVGKSMDQALARQQATAPGTVTIPAAASIHGIGGSFFHSELRVFNPSSTASVTVTARFRCFTGPCPAAVEKTFGVAPRELKVYDDVIGTLFGAPETAGAIELVGGVLAESRVYTPSKPAPTTGSDVPGLAADEAYAESVLTSLSRRGFRTNVGVYNPGAEPLEVSIDVYRADGAKLGSVTQTAGARSAFQVDVFGAAEIAESPADAYAIVRADGVHPLFAYATVIDEQSQDSVFVTGRNARGGEPFLTTIPAAASIHGVPPAFFHSDVRLYNPRGAAPEEVKAVYRCFTGSCPPPSAKPLVVQPGEMLVLDDAVASLFQAPETAGAIEISGDVLVDSRVYTPTRPAPTTGTGIRGRASSGATVEAVLLLLSHSADGTKGFRSNLGVTNPNPSDLPVAVSLRRPNGTEIARLERTVPALGAVQVNDVFVSAGVTSDLPAGYALVTADGLRSFFAYATVIDNQSQDSVYGAGRPLTAP